MAKRGSTDSFPPVVPAGTKALLLGSYPSPKSFAQGFYYGHPQNRFWPLVAALAGQPVPQTVKERRAFILRGRLALWDVLRQCSITGAQDASIAQPQPNAIAQLITQHGIQAVFCNGQAAHRFYTRLCQPQTGLAAVCLPSTSPANAAWGLARLQAAWQPLAPYLAPP
ncbi:DNA-deoxyinosine glycosylase [Ruminococcaceae bacterium OttesenSCG-928-O06]|nr:DNA-deoxyinosine glycosylase [Ruminococcaceae bacterium OttesenSCG-928-O06]